MTITRTTSATVPLNVGWEAEARQWVQWARTPGHDSYWRFHRDQFLRLLPSPGRQTLDIGCGEGRLTRDLKELGHRVVAIDSSRSMVEAAREFDPSTDVRLADATALPLDDACADLVIAFMSLQDIGDLPAAVREAARVLQPGGRFCLAIVHPINSAGSFEQASVDGRFIIQGDYLGAFQYADAVERDGLAMTFHSEHRPLEAYFLALEKAGFLVEALREPALPEHAIVSSASRRWQRIPYFLHLRALRP